MSTPALAQLSLYEIVSPADTCVAGVLGDGLLDWPGRRCATVLLGGCSFRCSYCQCPELLSVPRRPLPLESVLQQLDGADRGVEGVVVTGGEPTASEGLTDLLRELKAKGMSIKLDTNGASPWVLSSLLQEGLVDFVALDIKTTPERYDLVTRSAGSWNRVRRSVEIVIASGIEHEFRTTCYPSAILSADLPRLASHLVGGSRFAIQQFRPQRTLDPGAATVRPYAAEVLRRAALCCAVHLPTVVRGV